jgi:hypothetical protein
MKNRFFIVLPAIVSLLLCVYAGTILLKSGRQEKGKIKEGSRAEVNDVEPSEKKKTDGNIQSPEKNRGMRPVPFLTAVITYKDNGEGDNGESVTGKEVVYIDAANNKVSLEGWLTVEGGDKPVTIRKKDICDGKNMYKVDFEEKRAVSSPVKEGDAIEYLFMEKSYHEYTVTNATFLGRECTVYNTPAQEAYFWNGIPLKSAIMFSAGQHSDVHREAVEIKVNVPISADKFKVPSGIKVMTNEEVTEKIGKMLDDFSKRIKAREGKE